MSFKEIQQKLGVSDVEGLVVDCVVEGLIDAKMDQELQLVTVSKSVELVFGMNEWKGLVGKCDDVLSRLEGMLETVEGVKGHDIAAQ